VQPIGAEVARPAGPPRTDGRPFEEGLDVLADALVVVIVGEDEPLTTRSACGGAVGRLGTGGKIGHGRPV
jgi:hypothetical protein